MGFLGSFSIELEAERSKATDFIISYHIISYHNNSYSYIHFCSVTSLVYCKMHALIHESSPSCSLLCRGRGPCLCGWNYCSYAVTTDLHLPRFGHQSFPSPWRRGVATKLTLGQSIKGLFSLGFQVKKTSDVRGFRSFPRVSKLIQNHKQFTIASKYKEKIPFFIFFNGQ